MKSYDQLFIGGAWSPSSGDTLLEVRSPHTEEVIGHAPSATTDDIDRAVAAARKAFDSGPWPRLAPAERAAVVGRFRKLYAEKHREMADLLIEEMGMPSWLFANANTAGDVAALDWLLASVERFQEEQAYPGMFASELLVRQEQVGVVGA